ncbi:Thioredoxin domain-containing protein 9 -like protein [Capsicum annuum]|uniref:Thioredoxin domain-containing protein 9 -like protein n=1 Tax=Capsicum annuum TaxID=4072 RepID=A0A2G2ZC54_CAPAN|nr:Thioredoxin domain-containing protein 9 -like protein [Capsicum annuum]
MKKMAEKRSRWISLGHGEYTEIPTEKDFFSAVKAKKSPYLAEKLRIVVRPTLALIKNSKVDNYVVGFDELGGIDEFSTKELEERLARAEVIIFEGESSRILSKSKAQSKKSVTQSSNPESDSE